MHFFIKRRQNVDDVGSRFEKTVEHFKHKRTAEFLHTNGIGNLGKQQFVDAQFLVVEVSTEIKPAIAGDNIHRIPVFASDISEIIHAQYIAGSIGTFFQNHIFIVSQKIPRFAPSGHFIIGRVFDGHSIKCILLVPPDRLAMIQNCLYETAGTLRNSKHFDWRRRFGFGPIVFRPQQIKSVNYF
jgi:hypothetical protein